MVLGITSRIGSRSTADIVLVRHPMMAILGPNLRAREYWWRRAGRRSTAHALLFSAILAVRLSKVRIIRATAISVFISPFTPLVRHGRPPSGFSIRRLSSRTRARNSPSWTQTCDESTTNSRNRLQVLQWSRQWRRSVVHVVHSSTSRRLVIPFDDVVCTLPV